MKDKIQKKNKVQTTEIPDELWIEIFNYCNINTLLNAGLVSKHFYQLSSSDQVWRSIFLKSDVYELGTKTDHKKLYIKNIKPEKELYEYQKLLKPEELPKIKVLLMGNAVDNKDTTIKMYALKLNLQQNSLKENKSIFIETAGVSMGPKKHKVQFWDTSSVAQHVMISIKSNIRTAQVVVLFPRDIDNLKFNLNALKEHNFNGPIICCSDQINLINSAQELGCSTLQFKDLIPTIEEINKLNKTIIKVAGPDSVKDLIKIDEKTKGAKDIEVAGPDSAKDLIKKEKKTKGEDDNSSNTKCTIM